MLLKKTNVTFMIWSFTYIYYIFFFSFLYNQINREKINFFFLTFSLFFLVFTFFVFSSPQCKGFTTDQSCQSGIRIYGTGSFTYDPHWLVWDEDHCGYFIFRERIKEKVTLKEHFVCSVPYDPFWSSNIRNRPINENRYSRRFFWDHNESWMMCYNYWAIWASFCAFSHANRFDSSKMRKK